VARRKTVEDSTVRPAMLDDMMDALLGAIYKVPVRCSGSIPSSVSKQEEADCRVSERAIRDAFVACHQIVIACDNAEKARLMQS
jgi:hypothetical protein